MRLSCLPDSSFLGDNTTVVRSETNAFLWCRAMAVRLFTTGSFAVYGLLLWAVVIFTSNTANILAWGIFESTTQIASDFTTVIIYEAVHTSGALPALALGCWAAVLVPLVNTYRATEPIKVIPRFYLTLAVVFVAFLCVAIFCNLHLMRFPGDKWHTFWAHTLLESPSEFPWLTYWLFVAPLPVMIIASFRLWHEIHWWTLAACLLASLLLIFPLVLRTYIAHHYLCFSNPEIYSATLSALSPVFFILPITFVAFLDRCCTNRSQTSGGGSHNNG